MKSFSNITIIYDDISFVDALGDLLNSLDGVSVTKVQVDSFQVGPILDRKPDLILVDYEEQKKIKKLITKEFSIIRNIIPIFFIASDNLAYGDEDETKFNIFQKPIYFPIFLKSLKKGVAEFVGKKNKEVMIGPYFFNYLLKTMIVKDNREVRLTEMEAKILNFLYNSDGNLIKRDTLLKEVWGYNSEVMTHTLETHIYRLRKKIETDSVSRNLLISESGGYRLNL